MSSIQHVSAENVRTGWLYQSLRTPGFFRDIYVRRSLLWNFFRRDLLGRFRGSALGSFWVLIQPIFLFFVYFGIFGILFGPRDAEPGAAFEPNIGFAIYLFSGIIGFNVLNEGTSSALTSITGSANLVKKVKFPCEFMPLVPVLVAMAVYAVGCVVIVIAGAIAGEVHFTLKMLAWPFVALALTMFATGLGLFLAGVNVFVRDVAHLYRVFVQAWFFLSPVFWRLGLMRKVSDHFGLPWVADLFLFNPMLPILHAHRQVFGIGDTWPDRASVYPFDLATNILLSFAWGALTLFIGYGFFKSRRHKFADLV